MLLSVLIISHFQYCNLCSASLSSCQFRLSCHLKIAMWKSTFTDANSQSVWCVPVCVQVCLSECGFFVNECYPSVLIHCYPFSLSASIGIEKGLSMEALDPLSPGQLMQLYRWWLLEEGLVMTVKGTHPNPTHVSLVKCFPRIFGQEWLCVWKYPTKTVTFFF